MRFLSMECGRKCFNYNEPIELGNRLPVGERLCISRCFSKFQNIREVVDKAIVGGDENTMEEKIETPPLLIGGTIFAGNQTII